MEIIRRAISGTLESSDIQITIAKNGDKGIVIDLESPVKHLFEEEILSTIMGVLAAHEIKNAKVRALDKGALDCTIAARVQTAIYRAVDQEINWEVL